MNNSPLSMVMGLCYAAFRAAGELHYEVPYVDVLLANAVRSIVHFDGFSLCSLLGVFLTWTTQRPLLRHAEYRPKRRMILTLQKQTVATKHYNINTTRKEREIYYTGVIKPTSTVAWCETAAVRTVPKGLLSGKRLRSLFLITLAVSLLLSSRQLKETLFYARLDNNFNTPSYIDKLPTRNSDIRQRGTDEKGGRANIYGQDNY